jgi:sulfur-oxidizing protein SoxY
MPSRRGFLKTLGLGAVFGGVWRTGRSAAPKAAEPPGDLRKALAEALDGRPWTLSDAVRLEVPQLAENGAIVPITAESTLPDTTRILIFGEKNPGPLLAAFRFEPGADGWVSLRVKLNDSGRVLAIAEAGGKFYGTEKKVRVMVGGCG